MITCTSCGAALAVGDAFCGGCGAPAQHNGGPARQFAGQHAGQPGTATQPAPADDTVQAPHGSGAAAGPFFRHAERPAEGLPSNATRYLCAAAYLNPAYANVVIGELVASRRAVVPSVGFDLGPVIRHCLNARSIQLARDTLLTGLLVLSLVLATVPTIVVIAVAFALGFLPSRNWDRHAAATKVVIAVAVVAGAIVVLIILIGALSTPGAGFPVVGLIRSGPAGVIVAVFYAALVAVTVFGTTYNKYRILGEHLRPDSDAAGFSPPASRNEPRIAEVEAAQHGNVTLYSGENPFIGTGRAKRAWAIAVELDRAAPAGPDSWAKPDSRVTVAIDPVELHEVIRKRLLKLKDPALPDNERVSALEVNDHVVGAGRGRLEGPLMDPASSVPYSEASREAIEALIRHPQAGLRYYQRVSVNDEGQLVRSGGRHVLDRTDQEIAISAFVYVAVEGRMLYVEFVATVLPPVQRRYHVIDLLARLSPRKVSSLVLTDGVKELFAGMIGAPLNVIATLRLMSREKHSAEEEITSIHEFLDGNSGARISVRELGAAGGTQTYIQELDTAKYTKIIERLLNDTVLDFLTAKGVDTTAYRASASVAINNGTVITGGTVSGTVVGGLGATANMAQPPAATPTATPG